jgi:hypothetical protein
MPFGLRFIAVGFATTLLVTGRAMSSWPEESDPAEDQDEAESQRGLTTCRTAEIDNVANRAPRESPRK